MTPPPSPARHPAHQPGWPAVRPPRTPPCSLHARRVAVCTWQGVSTPQDTPHARTGGPTILPHSLRTPLAHRPATPLAQPLRYPPRNLRATKRHAPRNLRDDSHPCPPPFPLRSPRPHDRPRDSVRPCTRTAHTERPRSHTPGAGAAHRPPGAAGGARKSTRHASCASCAPCVATEPSFDKLYRIPVAYAAVLVLRGAPGSPHVDCRSGVSIHHPTS